ncbi:Ni/Fe-hydrogenase, b-type cytochrome subunit [Desulfosporosinus sp. PR]|uniref:Ni/Fe-hydrogenase, b-type cytochrome subunit n=1 Tax=Candidatus Desulfosporosinus nitrosoreducens TaxID=3401928 RepID=UPI0027ED7CF8|nr:Ni/Fe-hydrogenase, b-type cytochrome subunit [Desulfosporosinus sp. PR]MDQ7096833.1 Ni/Fe-hydrogenase, b-type cytochrome subunit [Desulfosporosinus sp. PR]
MKIMRSQVYVWQFPVRFFHWLNALAITVLFLTGMYIGHPVLDAPGEAVGNFTMGSVRYWHGLSAFVFMANMLFRLYWFWVGNEYSKMKLWRKDFWQDVVRTFKYYTFMTKEHVSHAGHNALAQLMYFFFIWLGGLLMILTGLAMRGGSDPNGVIQALFGWVVPLFRSEYQVRNLHHFLAWGYALFLLGHLYMVLRQDILDDDGTISSMINGYKYEISSLDKPNNGGRV